MDDRWSISEHVYDAYGLKVNAIVWMDDNWNVFEHVYYICELNVNTIEWMTNEACLNMFIVHVECNCDERMTDEACDLYGRMTNEARGYMNEWSMTNEACSHMDERKWQMKHVVGLWIIW